MKLLNLTIHNIASITDATIDFQEKPLADSKIFLISGITGSGKSTILDAICLALYQKTPRMENTKMSGEAMADDQATNGDKLRVDDTRLLMRRNTGEAWAKLEFEGGDGRKYCAQWGVRRARNKKSGAIQKVEWSLTDLEKNEQWTKKADIESKIKEIVGLDFTQFCRTTMLAQGEFTKFLNSNNDEKSAILEKILGVNIYSRIGAKIYEICQSKRADYEQAKAQVDGVDLMSDDQKAKAEAEKEGLDIERKRVTEERVKADSRLKWLNDDIRLREEEQQHEKDLAEATERISGEDFRRDEKIVADWRATIDARGFLAQMDKSENDKLTAESDIAGVESDYRKLLRGIAWQNAQLERLNAELAAIDGERAPLLPKEKIYENAKVIAQDLDLFHSATAAINGLNKSITEENTKLKESLRPSEQIAKDDCEKRLAAFKSADEGLSILVAKLKEANLGGLRKQKETLLSALGDVGTAQAKVEAFNAAKKRHDDEARLLEDIKTEIAEYEKAIEKSSAEVETAKKARDIAEEIYDKQRESVEDWVKNYRTKLKVGDTCPLCRQKIEHLEMEDVIEKAFRQVEDVYKNADADYREKSRNLDRLKAEKKAKESLSAETAKKCAKAASEVEKAKGDALKSCEKCGVATVDLAQLDEKVKALSAEMTSVDEKITSAETVEKQVQDKTAERDKLRAEKEAADKRIADIQKKITASENDIKTSERRIADREAEVSRTKESLSHLLDADSTWSRTWPEAPMEVKTAVADEAARFKNLTDKKAALEKTVENVKQMLDDVADFVKQIRKSKTEWSVLTADCQEQCPDAKALASSVSLRLNSAMERIKMAERTYQAEKDKLERFFENNVGFSIESIREVGRFAQPAIEDMEKRQRNLRDDVKIIKSRLEGTKKKQAAHAGSRPEDIDGTDIEHLKETIAMLDIKAAEVSERLGAINQQFENDAKNREKQKSLIENLNAKKKTFDSWNRLSGFVGDKTGKKFREIALSYILENLINSANHYMEKLTDRYRLRVRPGTYVIHVEDAYQGYAARAASTISGGESFLVSLALALALSDIAHQLKVNTLFIDEGFGSLSGEPLQKAIDTLSSLHRTLGRQVGVISHVEELRERIPVQIKVEQTANSSESRITVIPQ